MGRRIEPRWEVIMAKQRRDGLTFGQRLAMIVCTALVALVLVAGASYGL